MQPSVCTQRAAALFCVEKGSFCFLTTDTSVSAYNGVAFFDQDQLKMTKVIHNIQIFEQATCQVKKDHATRTSESMQEKFFFREGMFHYQAQGQGKIKLLFDIRDATDFSIEGRQHTIEQVDEQTAKLSAKGNTFFLHATSPFEIQHNWVETQTEYDKLRGSRDSWWVVDGIQFLSEGSTRFILCKETDISKAREAIKQDWERSEDTLTERDIAYQALNGLVVTTNESPAILAGLPWFHQVWSRDEAIAVGGLLVEQQYDTAAKILLRACKDILPDGRVSNRFPQSNVGSADGVGWVFVRLEQLFYLQQSALTAKQWGEVFDKLQLSLERLPMQDGLVINNPQETWMDTVGGVNDLRHGARIEIQALTLAMLRFANTLEKIFSRTNVFEQKEQEMKQRVKDKFFDTNRGILYDGIVDGVADTRIRSNVFLAAYVYKQLLTDKQWKQVLTNTCERLFLDWGAVASLDKNDGLFQSTHTGMSDLSYHRGDSWYFVNNIAAIVLSDHPKFHKEVQKIYQASLHDLMHLGAVGYASEISSAFTQEAYGCWNQAWSASTLLELMEKLNVR